VVPVLVMHQPPTRAPTSLARWFEVATVFTVGPPALPVGILFSPLVAT